MTPQKRLLMIVAVLVVAVGAYVMWPSTGVAPGTRGGVPVRAGAPGIAGESPVADIRLELLQRETGTLQTPNRNPFRFERREVASAPRARTFASRTPRGPQPIPEPEGPPPVPPPPPIPLRFIGFLMPTGSASRVAVLSDGRGNVFDGKEGDIIEGRYRLLRVGNDSADLIYLDGRGRQTIRLSGQ